MMNEKKKKMGLREIAEATHVSMATVSRVLNGNNRVDPHVQKTVLDMAAKLHVDLPQRNKTKALAFLLSNRAMLHAFHSRVLHGAEACCAAHGWEMIFLSFDYSATAPWNEIHLPLAVQRRDLVHAVILAGTNYTNLLELLKHKGIPSVVLGNNVIGESQHLHPDVVFSNETDGGYDITRYLIGLGHRHIGFVGNLRLTWFARCFAGYRAAMEEAGLTPIQSSIDSEDDSDIGYLGAKSLLSAGKPITAIFAGNDETAHGVYKALRDMGLQIPDDISVVGCDDTVGAWLYPGLTTIKEFPEQLGRQMVETIISRITLPDGPPQRVLIPTELIRRESCRPVPVSIGTPFEKPLKNAKAL